MPLIVAVKSEEALVDRPQLPKDDLLIVECRRQQEVHSQTSVLVLESNSGSPESVREILSTGISLPRTGTVSGWFGGWVQQSHASFHSEQHFASRIRTQLLRYTLGIPTGDVTHMKTARNPRRFTLEAPAHD